MRAGRAPAGPPHLALMGFRVRSRLKTALPLRRKPDRAETAGRWYHPASLQLGSCEPADEQGCRCQQGGGRHGIHVSSFTEAPGAAGGSSTPPPAARGLSAAARPGKFAFRAVCLGDWLLGGTWHCGFWAWDWRPGRGLVDALASLSLSFPVWKMERQSLPCRASKSQNRPREGLARGPHPERRKKGLPV